MAKPLQYAVTALRVLLLTVCVPLLLASLVLWPRSCFYVDHIEIPVDEKPPTKILSTTSPHTFYEANAIRMISSFGALSWEGPGRIRVSESPIARPWSRWSKRSSFEAVWRPIVARYQGGYPNVNGALNVTAPYWLPTAAALSGLAIAFPRRASSLFRWRVGIGSLLSATLGVALLISLSKAAGNGGLVLGVEAMALLLIARKACLAGGRLEGWNRVGVFVVAVLCLAGIAAIATFTGYVIAVPTGTLPQGSAS
jgi:hypothetical protein